MNDVDILVQRKFLRLLSSPGQKEKICTNFGFLSIKVPLVIPNSDYVAINVQLNDEFHKEADENFAISVQEFIENLATNEAEDSSYDSDDGGNISDDRLHSQRHHLHQQIKTELNPSFTSDSLDHEQVSRTTSDTLGQEFAEYVTTTATTPTSDEKLTWNLTSTSYRQKVEFALKLGYTERLVQAALSRLGSDPTQNELLAELIKLGAQHVGSSELMPSSSTAELCCNQLKFVGEVTTSSSGTQVEDQPIQLLNVLRPIVIDGSNVAMSHGNKEVYSCRGIKLCVDWFKNRGHKDITVFVPKWRKENSRIDNPIIEQEILNELERERMLVFTPSRLVGGKRMICYDDRYILKLASENDGIVVSNDNYRDLVSESCEFKKVVEERLLMYSFVNDRFMPPDDPLGRSGPTLDNFLRIQSRKTDVPLPCPYGKKCTYGNKCKFNHPERGLGPHKSVTERLSEHAARYLSARNSLANAETANRVPIQGKSLSVPLSSTCNSVTGSETNIYGSRKALCRSSKGNNNNQILKTMPKNSLPHSGLYQNSPNAGDEMIKFPKSHSIENISQYPNMQNYGGRLSSSKSTTGEPLDETVNLHRKLHRQLTLNPAGCDPRIYQLQQRHQLNTPTSTQSGVGTDGVNISHHSHSGQMHRPLAPSLSSGPRSKYHNNQWADMQHPSVTRIASAPDQPRPCSSGMTSASSSEPHINLWPHQQQHFFAAQDQRRRLHYHLASIFPEEQVQTVMQMYPDETNPQTICAAILSMFSKN